MVDSISPVALLPLDKLRRLDQSALISFWDRCSEKTIQIVPLGRAKIPKILPGG